MGSVSTKCNTVEIKPRNLEIYLVDCLALVRGKLWVNWFPSGPVEVCYERQVDATCHLMPRRRYGMVETQLGSSLDGEVERLPGDGVGVCIVIHYAGLLIWTNHLLDGIVIALQVHSSPLFLQPSCVKSRGGVDHWPRHISEPRVIAATVVRQSQRVNNITTDVNFAYVANVPFAHSESDQCTLPWPKGTVVPVEPCSFVRRGQALEPVIRQRLGEGRIQKHAVREHPRLAVPERVTVVIVARQTTRAYAGGHILADSREYVKEARVDCLRHRQVAFNLYSAHPHLVPRTYVRGPQLLRRHRFVPAVSESVSQ